MVTDTISDLLTRIRNALLAKHQIVQIPLSCKALAVISILKNEGFIEDFEIFTDNNYKSLLISLKYIGQSRQSVINHIQRISRPGLRVYTSAKKIPKVLNDLGIAIISTSKGVMTNLTARKLGIGGEILCYIW